MANLNDNLISAKITYVFSYIRWWYFRHFSVVLGEMPRRQRDAKFRVGHRTAGLWGAAVLDTSKCLEDVFLATLLKFLWSLVTLGVRAYDLWLFTSCSLCLCMFVRLLHFRVSSLDNPGEVRTGKHDMEVIPVDCGMTTRVVVCCSDVTPNVVLAWEALAKILFSQVGNVYFT